MRKVKLFIFIVLFCCSCASSQVKGVRVDSKVRKDKVNTGQTFLIVAAFMLGYGVTEEYFLEKK